MAADTAWTSVRPTSCTSTRPIGAPTTSNPNMCWECYSCVKACPQNAIDARGYADFAPLGHSVRTLREEAKGTISWRIEFRDGRVKEFVSPIRTTPVGIDPVPGRAGAAERGSAGIAGARPRTGRAQHREPARAPTRSLQAGSALVGLFKRRKTVHVNSDILVVGGGMAGCGATYESRYWGRDLDIVCVEKANIERSGAVAQGLYAINCYMGMQWGENQPEDHVRYARNDLMGLVREDLGYDIARHVDSTVHKFEEWGLPIMRDPETGRYQREGKWQIMIHGESYKPIVAEAARKAATRVYNRIIVTHLLMDEAKPNRVAGAVGFNVRTGDFHVFRAKAVIVCAGGASHIYKPRAVGEGMGRTWYAPWSSASAYGLPILAGAKMTQMENRIVPHSIQGRLRPGGRVLPAPEDLYRERLRGGVRIEVVRPHQGIGGGLHRHAPGADLSAQPRPSRGGEGGQGSHSHGDEGGVSGPPQGNHRLGELPRHDHRAGGGVGVPEHRSEARQSRADHLGALRHGFTRHLLGRMGERAFGLRSGRVPVGIQPDDDRRRALRRRRHHRRNRPQVLLRILHRRPHRRQGGGQVRERPAQGAAPGQ